MHAYIKQYRRQTSKTFRTYMFYVIIEIQSPGLVLWNVIFFMFPINIFGWWWYWNYAIKLVYWFLQVRNEIVFRFYLYNHDKYLTQIHIFKLVNILPSWIIITTLNLTSICKTRILIHKTYLGKNINYIILARVSLKV